MDMCHRQTNVKLCAIVMEGVRLAVEVDLDFTAALETFAAVKVPDGAAEAAAQKLDVCWVPLANSRVEQAVVCHCVLFGTHRGRNIDGSYRSKVHCDKKQAGFTHTLEN